MEQKVGLSPADSAFRYQTDKDRRASEPVASRVRDLPSKTQPTRSLINLRLMKQASINSFVAREGSRLPSPRVVKELVTARRNLPLIS